MIRRDRSDKDEQVLFRLDKDETVLFGLNTDEQVLFGLNGVWVGGHFVVAVGVEGVRDRGFFGNC